ncbi:hypothetical protein SEA_ASHBALLER_96 [Mycobacterium phage Ashballer]|nr:hypothetical protein SEA_ASHBALLER_96 [Mycobacterium phage Ashballer]
MRCESAHPGPAYPAPCLPAPPARARPAHPHPTLPCLPLYPAPPAAPQHTPCLCDALCPMRQRLGTEDAPSSMPTRLRMRCGSGSTGAPHRGDARLRDRADVPGSKLAFDADRIDGSGSSSSDASTFGGRPARRMTVWISLRWGQSRCSRSIAWFEGG